MTPLEVSSNFFHYWFSLKIFESEVSVSVDCKFAEVKNKKQYKKTLKVRKGCGFLAFKLRAVNSVKYHTPYLPEFCFQ